MAYNQGLSQEEKDRINKQMRDLLAQGKSKEEARAWGDAQVQASLAAGKTNPSAGTDAPAVSGGSASGAGSSVSLNQFAQTAGRKKPRTDDNGEVINLAEDFGEVGVFVENLPFIGDVIDDMYGAVKQGYAQGQTVDDALGLFASGDDADSEQIRKYIEAVNKMQGRPPSDEMLDFDKTFDEAGGGAWGFIKAIAKNPSVAVNTAISSMVAMMNPASAAGAGVGAAGGAAVGAGFAGVGAAPGAIGGMFAGAGGVLETGVSFTEFLQEEIKKKGLDFNEDGIAKVLEDEEAMLRVRGKAAARGGVIAIIDGLTAGVASKAAKGVAGNAVRLAKLKGVLTATAIEGAGGGLGETAARLVVGQELDAKEIGLEIVGEFGTGATIGKAAVETQPSYEIGGQKVNRRQIEAMIKDDPASLGAVKVKNDPEITSQINEKISGSKDINNNLDIITKEEKEARNELVDNIAKAKKDQLRFKRNTPEYAAYTAVVEKARAELKEVVKTQNQNYKHLNQEQKDAITGAEQQAANFDAAIATIQNKYKKGQEINAEDQLIIDQFQELKAETLQNADEARAQGVALGQQKAAEAEARAAEKQAEQEAVAQEEAVEEEAEQLGVDPAALQAQREEAQGIIDEEASDNQQAIGNLEKDLVTAGVRLEPVQGGVDSSTPDNYIPLGKKKDTYSKGDFEKNIVTKVPMERLTAEEKQFAIQDEADAKGWETDVKVVELGPEQWGLEGTIKAAKRKEPVSVQVQNQQAEATQPTAEEYAPDQGELSPAGAVVGEKVDVKEGDDAGPVKQRTAPSKAEAAQPIAEKAEQYKAEDLGDNTYSFNNNKNKYAFINSLKRRGHAVTENPDGTVSVEKDAGVAYSVDEDRNYDDDQITDLVFKHADYIHDNNISQKDYDTVLPENATKEDLAEFSDRMNYQLDREQEGPSFSADEATSIPQELLDMAGDPARQAAWYLDASPNEIKDLGFNSQEDVEAAFEKIEEEELEDFLNDYPEVDRDDVYSDEIFNERAENSFRGEYGYSVRELIDAFQDFEWRLSKTFKDKVPRTIQSIWKNAEREPYTEAELANAWEGGRDRLREIGKLTTEGKKRFNEGLRREREWIDSQVKKEVERLSNKSPEEGPSFSVDEASAPENFTQHANLREVAGNRIKMNIGLENNPIDNINGIIKKLQSDKRVRLGTTEQVTGEYEGNPERTVVVDAKFDGTASQFRDYIEKLNADLTQEAIGVQFNGRGSLIYDPKFKGDRYTFDPQFFVQPSEGNKKLFGEVDEKDLLVEAGPGQRYEKITLEQASRGSAALAGGKGGFASGGDARESVGQLTEADKKANEAARKAAAALGKVHNLPVGQPLSSEERSTALRSIRQLARSFEVAETSGYVGPEHLRKAAPAKKKIDLAPTEGNISYGIGKDGVAMTGNTLTQADVDYLNDQYDKLAGYKGAHNHPDRNYRIGVVNNLNKPQRRGAKAPKTPLSGNRADQITLKGGSRTVDHPIIQSKPEKNIVLGKDVKEREGTGQFPESFDRRDIGPENRTNLRQNIGKQPKVDEKFIKDYNDNKISDDQLIKSLTPFILGKQRNKELQGFAIEKFTEIVKGGKLKGKSVKQIFGAAKNAAGGAATFRNQQLGQSKDYQRQRNVVRRAEQAFFAKNGYNPSTQEISDFINDNKNRYNLEITPDQVEDARFDELPEVELGGKQGEARDRAQTRIAREAGLDQLTTQLIGEDTADIDAAVEPLIAQRPVTPSQGKFTNQAPRRGAKFTTEGDKDAARIKKSNTEIDKDINYAISKKIGRNELVDNYQFIKDLLGLTAENFDDLSRAEKQDLKRKVVKGLAQEAEQRLGKQTGPSQESAFSVGERGVELTPASQEYTNEMAERLQAAWPDIEVVTDQSEYNKLINEYEDNSGRKVPPRLKGAYFPALGKVGLNPSKVTLDTHIHEFGHIWARQLMRENPQLWVKGRALLAGSKYEKAVKGNSAYAGLKGFKLTEEIMANALGKRGAEMFKGKEAKQWDNWLKKVGDWIKSNLGINSKKDFKDITLEDWLDTGVHGIFKGETPAPPSDPYAAFSVEEDPASQPDIAAAYLAGKAAEGKWYKAPLKWLIPPAADDYHGLVSKLKNIPGVKKVTDAFVRNHQAHIEKVTKAREDIKKITKKLGIPLDKKDVVTYKGNKLTAAQAIQAHVNGFPNEFSNKPEVQDYIEAMTELGVLKPNDRYDLASPAADLYSYLNNDLYEESFRDFNAAKAQVFNDSVMEQITAQHGDKYAEALGKALQRMSSGKNSNGFTDKTTQKWNDWALGSVGTIMFLNFRSAALQMMSVANFGFDAKSPGKFIANFFNPDTYAEAKKLYNSAYLKERRARAGFDVNAAEMLDAINNSKSFSDFTKKVLNKGFIATSAVDSMAIAMGGASFIKAQVDSGVSRSEAISQWKESTEEAQQSARPDRVSQWQTEGISKFILAFANTPQQYFRLAQKAARSIKEGKDVKKNLAKIGYYMMAQNMLFTMAQAASLALLGGGDDEQEVRDGLNSMSSTILRGMGLYGAVIDSAKNVIMEAIKQEGKSNPDHITTALKATGIAPPLNRKIQDLLAIGRAHNYNADDKWTTTAAKGIAVTTNLPSDWAQKKYNASKNLWDDQFSAWQKLLMMAGWSEWNFKEGKKKGDFDSVDFGDVDFASEEFESVEF